MDGLVPNRRFVLIWIAAMAMACGGPGLSPVGVSAPREPERAVAMPDSGTSEPAPVPPNFRSHMTRLSERFLSRGHGQRFEAIVWGNDGARSRTDADAGPGDGAVFVEEAIARDSRGDRPAGLLVMTEAGDSFRFDEVDPDGRVAGRDRVAACAACHRETKGSVFPLPPSPEAP